MEPAQQRAKYLGIQKELIEIVDFHNIPVSAFYLDKLTTTSFENFKFYFPWFIGSGTVDEKLRNLFSKLGIKSTDYEPELISHIHDLLEWLLILAEL